MKDILPDNGLFRKADVPPKLADCFESASCGCCYVCKMVEVFRGVWRVLRDDGTCWVNLGDSYNAAAGPRKPTQTSKHGYWENENIDRRINYPSLKPKDLIGMSWRLAFALQADGWYLRSDIIWHKPNPMPESVTDRPTKAHEYLFLLSKNPRYFYDADAVREEALNTCTGRTPGMKAGLRQQGKDLANANYGGKILGVGLTARNRRTVWPLELKDWIALWEEAQKYGDIWKLPTQSFAGAHFATFPSALIEPCIMAGTSEKGCCPECGTPWKRLVEKERVATRPGNHSKVYVDPEGSPYEHHSGEIIGNRDPKRHCSVTTTVAWESGCGCDIFTKPPRKGGTLAPGVVLDPFAGSGTTLQVARWLGRGGIGIELSKDYCELAVRRIQQPRDRRPAAAPLPDQMQLF